MSEPLAVVVTAGRTALPGDLSIPAQPTGVVVFAHGSGSGRTSPRNRAVAEALVDRGFATLLFDLLTGAEAIAEQHSHHLRFNIPLLANRLVGAIEWVHRQDAVSALPIGLFGASTGAAAALIASARTEVAAVVSRGGRPDLAGDALYAVRSPTLLIVGGRDTDVLQLNRQAQRRIPAATSLHVVPHATHLFEEPGALREVVDAAAKWFGMYIGNSRWLAEHAISREI